MRTLKLAAAVSIVACLQLGNVPTAKGDFMFSLSASINGMAPDSTSLPYLTASFHQVDAQTVQLTMTNLLPSTDLVDKWLFNYKTNATGLVATYVSGTQATVTASSSQSLTGGNDLKAGLFDVMFAFQTTNTSKLFSGGTTSVFDLKLSGGGKINANDFMFVSADKPKPNGEFGGWVSAALLQGFCEGGSVGAVPEPSSFFMLSLGGIGLAFGAIRRRRQQTDAV
jgi:hypothetical protein